MNRTVIMMNFENLKIDTAIFYMIKIGFNEYNLYAFSTMED